MEKKIDYQNHFYQQQVPTFLFNGRALNLGAATVIGSASAALFGLKNPHKISTSIM